MSNRKKILYAVLSICLLFISVAQAASTELVRNGNQVSGEVSVNGWTFPVDACLTTASGLGGNILCTPMTFERAAWEQALEACFPGSGRALAEQLCVENGMVSASLRYVDGLTMYPALLPASQQTMDSALEGALTASLAFCQAVGLQVDAQPLSCAWVLNNDLGIRMTLQPEEAASYGQKLLMEVWLPLCADSSVLIPHVQVPRYHGTINFSGSDELLAQTPGARFLFDAQGALLSFQASLMELSVTQTAAEGMNWQDALDVFLTEYTENPQVQMLLATAPYTITSIRSAWDLTETNTGSRGWMITLFSRVPREDSPTGWRDRYYTAFVYGGST